MSVGVTVTPPYPPTYLFLGMDYLCMQLIFEFLMSCSLEFHLAINLAIILNLLFVVFRYVLDIPWNILQLKELLVAYLEIRLNWVAWIFIYCSNPI